MIYDFPEPSSSISQGDIFFGVPILDLTDDELPVIDDEGNVQALPWETFASAGESVSALVAVRPTIAIVGTQECDALRAPNITLFEVRPFRDVERKSKETSKPSKWIPLITQHARINQKWFYLPADERIGFTEKMGADFLTPIRIPRLVLERLLTFRKGRLNEVAKQHFRERLAEFFRRYAYDEWYPLTREELAEYQKNHPDAEPFPWQRVNPASSDERVTTIGVERGSEKGFLDFLADAEKASEEVAGIIRTIDAERRDVESKLEQHTSQILQLKRNPGAAKVSDYKKIARLAASDINTFSTLIEDLLPKFANAIRELDVSCSACISSVEPTNDEEIVSLRNAISQMLDVLKPMKKSVNEFKDAASLLEKQNVSQELTSAAGRQSQVVEGIIVNLEELESYALRMVFLVGEKFGEPPSLEDKTK